MFLPDAADVCLCAALSCLGPTWVSLAFLFHCRLFFPEGHETSPRAAFFSHPAQEHSWVDSTTSSCPACARQDRLVFQVPIPSVTVSAGRPFSLSSHGTCRTGTAWWCKSTHAYSCSELTHFNISFKCFFKNIDLNAIPSFCIKLFYSKTGSHYFLKQQHFVYMDYVLAFYTVNFVMDFLKIT